MTVELKNTDSIGNPIHVGDLVVISGYERGTKPQVREIQELTQDYVKVWLSSAAIGDFRMTRKLKKYVVLYRPECTRPHKEVLK